MARCPFAQWRGDNLPNETPRGMISHRGLVLHVQESDSEAGTDSWFHNPVAQASAHFGVAEDGSLDQWVDTDDKSWAEAAGNPFWVSVEIGGHSGRPATPAQVATLARLYKWGVDLYGWPNEMTDSPSGYGLGWHGMGGADWGGHFSCPGDPIKAQRHTILVLAEGGPTPTPEPPGGTIMLDKPDPKLAIAVIDRPAGGKWVVFQDGGVANIQGAPFYGSYPLLNQKIPQKGVGVFTGAALRSTGDGFTLLRQDGGTYDFGKDLAPELGIKV